MLFSSIIVGIVSGFAVAVVSSYFGPKYLEEWREKQREMDWAAPRKQLLKKKLKLAKGGGWVSLKQLSRLCGASEEHTRTLLIEIDARGGTLKGDREGWALISRQPLDKLGTQDVGDDDNG